MASGSGKLCICDVTFISGQHITFQANCSWSVCKLRKYVRKIFRIPEYEQQYAFGLVHLRSNELLADILELHGVPQLSLSLLRSKVPDGFAHCLVRDMWRSFLKYSTDEGDTVPFNRIAEVARSGGLFRTARMVPEAHESLEAVSFPHLLDLVASLKSATPAEQVRERRNVNNWFAGGNFFVDELEFRVRFGEDRRREDIGQDEDTDDDDLSSCSSKDKLAA
eukprot:TRINITY_DN25828_c0_g1_i1.p1 TRINITY_DN25828_c0_g1~~TRINITY_DN25828_c0_g1_i1.p1  ORF type:complete len:222 (+),score=34.52 TRINITY_DN25828_c0_g1_i1:118-783(+)